MKIGIGLGVGRGVRLGGGGGVSYLFRDNYSVAFSAGSVNGTLADTGDARTVTDTESKLSIAGGKAVYAGGKASAGFGDPSLWYPSRSRTPGEVLSCQFAPTQLGKFWRFGYTTTQSGTNGDHTISTGTAGALTTLNGTLNRTVGEHPTQNLAGAIALRATGADYFTHGGYYNYPRLLWPDRTRTTATIYPNHQGFDATLDVEAIGIQDELWLPTPLASDGFSAWGTTDGLGHAEGGGDLGGGGDGEAWTGQAGTWGAAAGAASASALSGGLAIATVDLSTVNVFAGVKVTRSGGVAGLVLRYYSAAHYVYVVHTGTNVQVIKRLNNVETTLINVAIAYSAGAMLWGWADAHAYTAIYNGTQVSAPAVQYNEVLTIEPQFGLYTTDTTNTFDDFVVYALGNEGQYTNMPILPLSVASTRVYCIGDSKTAGSGDSAYVQGYPRRMHTNSRHFYECTPRLGISGATAATIAVRVATDVAAVTGTPEYVLINLGANDVAALPAEATWKADMTTIIDAAHTQWPSASIYIMRPWRRNYATECDSLATWIDDLVAARSSYCHVGPDERVFLENGDDGATYTGDGIHPTAAGYALVASQWRTSIGL